MRWYQCIASQGEYFEGDHSDIQEGEHGIKENPRRMIKLVLKLMQKVRFTNSFGTENELVFNFSTSLCSACSLSLNLRLNN
jgi:hypothetical protein